MIKCKIGECPKGKNDICCFSCDTQGTCDEVCKMNNETCNQSVNVPDEDPETQLTAFKDNHVAILQDIANVVLEKKKIEEKEKKLKETLKEAMETYGIKSFDNEILKFTYIAATTATSIDSPKLKKKYPQIAEECSKVSPKAAYVKIEVK